MINPTMSKSIFWLLAASVLILALVPGPLGQVIESDIERHFLAFLILPAVAYIAWPGLSRLGLWLGFAAFGAGIELAQWAMKIGREAQWSDWMNDLIATSTSLTICWVFQKVLGAKSSEASL